MLLSIMVGFNVNLPQIRIASLGSLSWRIVLIALINMGKWTPAVEAVQTKRGFQKEVYSSIYSRGLPSCYKLICPIDDTLAESFIDWQNQGFWMFILEYEPAALQKISQLLETIRLLMYPALWTEWHSVIAPSEGLLF